jgi:hypothetical protein
MKSNVGLLTCAFLFLIAAGFCLYFFYPTAAGNTKEALTLSAVVMVALAMVVVLMAVLVIVFQVLGLANSNQALALPEGSVRALIAFSLVLAFVCLAAFLYSNMSSVVPLTLAGSALNQTDAQLNDLKAQFVVVYQQAKEKDGTPSYVLKTDKDGVSIKDDKGNLQKDLTKPLYDVNYFIKRSGSADDFAKQIFTTLATVFVSVVSFYFGSSTASAGVGVGAKAAQAAAGGMKGDPQSALAEARASADDAQKASDRAKKAAQDAANIADKAPNSTKAAAQDHAAKAKVAQDAAAQATQDANQQVDVAARAASDAGAADATKASTAVADAIKARDAAKAAADRARQGADEAERLLKQIKSETGTS